MDVLQSFGNKNPEAEAAKMLHLKLECIAAHVDVCRAHQRINASAHQPLHQSHLQEGTRKTIAACRAGA
jgi:hypothetical protein